jgi:hypothetical protein
MIACLVWGPLGLAEKAQSSPRKISISDTKIDQNFIRLMEGSKLNAYVPLVHSTWSGVTIAHGVDLGQLSLKEFNNLPIEWSLKRKLHPYVGLKKYAAQNYLRQHPLSITLDESKELNMATADKILLPLMKKYNHDSGKSFLELPPVAQTVLFSYAYQNGSAFMYSSRSRPLWKAFTSQNWSNARQQLRASHTYKSRRFQEAALLEQLR